MLVAQLVLSSQAPLGTARLPPTKLFDSDSRPVSGKLCTPSNTHGFNSNDFVRARLVGTDEVPGPAGGSAWTANTTAAYRAVPVDSEASVSVVLEVFSTQRRQWRRLRWDQLSEHLPHAPKVHMVFVGADMDAFAHAHPDSFASPQGEQTHFTVHLALPVAQPYSLSVEFMFNADAADLCTLESNAHSHGPPNPYVGERPASLAEVASRVHASLVVAAALGGGARPRKAAARRAADSNGNGAGAHARPRRGVDLS